MARVTTTVYVCDGCGVEVAKKKELRKFVLQHRGHRDWEEATSDLCDDCESKLILAVASLFDQDALVELRREA